MQSVTRVDAAKVARQEKTMGTDPGCPVYGTPSAYKRRIRDQCSTRAMTLSCVARLRRVKYSL